MRVASSGIGNPPGSPSGGPESPPDGSMKNIRPSERGGRHFFKIASAARSPAMRPNVMVSLMELPPKRFLP